MKINLPFEKQDYKLLRAAAIVLLMCVSTALILYFGANRINDAATLDVENARSQYSQALASVQLIAEEEATIVRYIDRYKEFVESGYLFEEERLALIESVADIRNDFNLYPIEMDIGEQNSFSLQYDPLDLNVGDPVNINYSNVELSYSLLHEEDFTRLLGTLLDSGAFLLPTQCEMSQDDVLGDDFSTIDERMSASCNMFWYTFDLTPPEPVYDEY